MRSSPSLGGRAGDPRALGELAASTSAEMTSLGEGRAALDAASAPDRTPDLEAAPVRVTDFDLRASGGRGDAHETLRRDAPARFADDMGAMVEGLPSARAVSNAVFQQSAPTPSSEGFSNFLWMWGQFLDHDISLTEAAAGGDAADIAVPVGDPFFDPSGGGAATIGFTRVAPVEGSGEMVDGVAVPRAYENEITALLDSSNVYGSTPEQTAALRAPGGLVRLDEQGLIEATAEGAPVAGDVRAFENVNLTAMHALFAREHNRQVETMRDDVAAAYPDLAGAALDDKLFNEARIRVEAIMQAITFNEFLPKLVGEGAFEAYDGHDPNVDPQISVEFSTAIYRVGHTMLSSELQRLDEAGAETAGGHLALAEAFFSPEILAEEGADPLLRGAAATMSQEVDALVVEDVRSFLFGPPGAGGFDLVALNIQRGRDLGVAAYNDLRAAYGLDRKTDFLDVTGGDSDLAAKLASVYASVDQIDAWVGGLAEAAVPGGVLGELFSHAIVDQFTRLRDGDPFWSEGRGFDEGERAALWSTTLSDVILRNTDIEHLQDDVFRAYARQGGDEGRDRMRGTEGSDLLIGFAGDDRILGGRGDDALFGDEGRDYLDGAKGDDVLVGGLGADRLMGGAGDDRLEGGDGRDYLSGQEGDDALIAGAGDDVLAGGDGADSLTGGAGRDRFMFYGDDHADSVITDFEEGDVFHLYGAEAKGGVTLSAVGGDVLATVGDHFRVLIEGVDLALVLDNSMLS